jgi:dihydrofolate reductase
MRDLIVTENITLDGVIDASAGWFDPANAEDQSDLIAALAEQREAADAVLTGRTTFESMRSYWPQQTDDQTGVSEYLNRVHKYVLSSTLEAPQWEPTTILRSFDEIAALKQADGGDIVVTGSLTLVPELMRRELVDEYRLFVYPTAVGEGQRLFTRPLSLRLVETRAFRAGVVLLRYRAPSEN